MSNTPTVIDEGTQQTVSVRVPVALVERFEETCAKHELSRSDALRLLMEEGEPVLKLHAQRPPSYVLRRRRAPAA